MRQVRLRELVRRFLPVPLRRMARWAVRGGRAPDRADALRMEVHFWRTYLETGGARWPEDYRNRLDPEYPLQAHVANVVEELAGDEVRLLDVGAGPLTKLGKKHGAKTVRITAVDILAAEYGRLLAELRIVPLVRTVPGDAEGLRGQFGENAFDIVHAVNALDHTARPLNALREMLAVVREGGSIVLSHYENEGARQDYDLLHQWNFTCEDGDFVLRDRSGSATNVTRAFEARAETRCARDGDGASASIVVTMRKRG